MSAFTNIPALPAGIALIGTEAFWCVQQGVDVRVTAAQIAAYAAQAYPLSVPTTTVAGLSSLNSKMLAQVTDGTAAQAWGATVVGGGSTSYLVWWNGSAWTVVGK